MSSHVSVPLRQPGVRPKCARRGFNLVELLIVIAILAILLALVGMGVVGPVHDRYDTMHCQWNMNHIYKALQVNEEASLPDPDAWISEVIKNEAQDCLRCPRGMFSGDEGYLSGSGMDCQGIVEIDPPPSVVFNTLESNHYIMAFAERENYKLPSAISVDISVPGRYTGNAKSEASIAAGTIINCYFLYFDPVGQQSATSAGQIEFNGRIIGIICHDSTLDNTDGTLGAQNVSYPTGQNSRGFEGVEDISLQPDQKTLTINHFHSTFPGENVRVITVGKKGGGAASYGINNQIDDGTTWPGQILLVEYEQAIADYDGQDEDDDWLDRIAPRHNDRMNVLTVEGACRTVDPDDIHPHRHPALWAPRHVGLHGAGSGGSSQQP